MHQHCRCCQPPLLMLPPPQVPRSASQSLLMSRAFERAVGSTGSFCLQACSTGRSQAKQAKQHSLHLYFYTTYIITKTLNLNPNHYIPLHSTTFHNIPFNYFPLHSFTFHSTLSNSILYHSFPLNSLNSIIFNYISFTFFDETRTHYHTFTHTHVPRGYHHQ